MRIGKILNFFDSLKSLKISSLQTKKASITLTFIFVIRLGLEPKTYCLEGSCSIQLSYRTCHALFRIAGAKVYNFWQTAKYFPNIYLYQRAETYLWRVARTAPGPA